MPPGKTNQPHNPYASAAGAYGNNAQKGASDPRELEARVLLKSAHYLTDLQNKWESVTPDMLQETLLYNRNIWMMFYDTAIESDSNSRPKDLRNNIYNLAIFIFKREIEILANPSKEKLNILIQINREIANGLMTSVQNNPLPAGDSASAKNDPVTSSDSGEKKPPTGGGWDSSA